MTIKKILSRKCSDFYVQTHFCSDESEYSVKTKEEQNTNKRIIIKKFSSYATSLSYWTEQPCFRLRDYFSTLEETKTSTYTY